MYERLLVAPTHLLDLNAMVRGILRDAQFGRLFVGCCHLKILKELTLHRCPIDQECLILLSVG